LIIANSDSGRRALLSRGVAASRVVVVRNGLDLMPFVSAGARRRPLSPASDGPTLGMIARMEPDKDQEMVLRALVQIRERYPSARLVLAGDGRRRERIESLIHTLGLDRCVTLLGDIDQPHQVLSEVDIYVQPSRVAEGTSNSIIEAMASGLPVVATDLGGNCEVVADGVTGFLVPTGNPIALATALLRLLDAPEEATRMGRAGSARALSLYSREAMVSSTVATYESSLRRAVPG
jgi:glycosyltransferase involved in cell wall biosynthesis